MSDITTGDRISYERGKEEGQQEQAQTLVLLDRGTFNLLKNIGCSHFIIKNINLPINS
ncbi:hypothetical protein [Nostoc sphaeroides]|uniref:Uncharacterized protein n=1 Tax=Nostoc sphaeroides CCNUC1 TaxID=2653204 RepID=A0A5P8W5X0_9NOSO|nr:hypothetical protein [Nostoc sphaeroides]QFS48044.1 hypothetical protein GXM_05536 [Nostoc sphaeroides CCNUC1]